MLTGAGRQKLVRLLPSMVAAWLVFTSIIFPGFPALSLEIQTPSDGGSAPAAPEAASPSVPSCTTDNCPETPAETTPQTEVPPDSLSPANENEIAIPDKELKGPVEVFFDIKKVPAPVAKMREMIVEAAASGDISRLKDLMNPGPNQTEVVIGEHSEDPIAELKNLSGDPDGLEILAILLDILSTGYVHVGQGTKDEVFVWPYFAEKSLDSLTAPEKVELLRLVTAGDVADMKEFGGYNFYRVGISPDGTWKFFVAGN